MMKNFIAEKYQDFKLSPLTKTGSMARKYEDVINLSIGNPDYPADENMLQQAFKDVVETNSTKYEDFFGNANLIEATREMYLEDYDYKIKDTEVLVTAGGTNAMHIVFETLLNEGDEVILISPYYPDYIGQLDMCNGKPVVYETKWENNFKIDAEELETLVTSRTKLIVVNSPNNPSGKVYDEEDLNKIMEVAQKHDFLVLADDIYTALNYEGKAIPLCTLEKAPERVITIYSYSKDFAVPGIRLGHIVANEELIDMMCSVAETVDFTVNSISQKIGYYALKNRHEIQKSLVEEYKKRVFYCYERIKNIPKMHCIKPEGTFYLFINIQDTGHKSFDIWEKLLDEAHIVVLPGAAFGPSGEGHIRIACTVGVETLKEAFDRLEKLEMFQ